MNAGTPLLEVRNLTISFQTSESNFIAVDNVSWRVAKGETLAVLGESGSGKSVSTSAIMNLVDMPPGKIDSGEIVYHGKDLLKLSLRERRAINGAGISMIFQDPLAALNPVHPVGRQIAETMRIHGAPSDTIGERVLMLMKRVGIPEPERRIHDYPHQFSGGQRQRIMIAAAIALQPDLLIADEPTSALDVTVQAQVLDLLKEIQLESAMGLVIITHDLNVVSRIADSVVVMQAGRIVETGAVGEVLTNPQHPYTKQLLDAVPGCSPRSHAPLLRSEGREPLVSVKNVTRIFGTEKSGLRAVNNVSFDVAPGETLGIIGESGSGKSTLARMLLGLDKQNSGSITIGGTDVSSMSRRKEFELRRRMQFVFQDPTASLNPRMTVAQIVAEPWAIHPGVKARSEWRDGVTYLLERVGLSPHHLDRYPHEFSGGQRQRIAIARALALKPELIICDEAVSALDASIRAQVMDLLRGLRAEFGLAYIFIAHDLGLVRDFASSVLVMYRGEIVEAGPVSEVLTSPRHPYTQKLLAASEGEMLAVA